MDDNSDKKAESMKQWRERKKESKREIDNEKPRTYYQNHKKEILRKRKDKRLQQDAKPMDSSTSQDSNEVDDTESFFPSWMAKKRTVDNARRMEVLEALLHSPTMHKSLSKVATINSPEQEGEVRIARALISDLSSVLDATKPKHSDGARATTCVGLSMLCGSTVAEGNMH